MSNIWSSYGVEPATVAPGTSADVGPNVVTPPAKPAPQASPAPGPGRSMPSEESAESGILARSPDDGAIKTGAKALGTLATEIVPHWNPISATSNGLNMLQSLAHAPDWLADHALALATGTPYEQVRAHNDAAEAKLQADTGVPDFKNAPIPNVGNEITHGIQGLTGRYAPENHTGQVVMDTLADAGKMLASPGKGVASGVGRFVTAPSTANVLPALASSGVTHGGEELGLNPTMATIAGTLAGHAAASPFNPFQRSAQRAAGEAAAGQTWQNRMQDAATNSTINPRGMASELHGPLSSMPALALALPGIPPGSNHPIQQIYDTLRKPNATTADWMKVRDNLSEQHAASTNPSVKNTLGQLDGIIDNALSAPGAHNDPMGAQAYNQLNAMDAARANVPKGQGDFGSPNNNTADQLYGKIGSKAVAAGVPAALTFGAGLVPGIPGGHMIAQAADHLHGFLPAIAALTGSGAGFLPKIGHNIENYLTSGRAAGFKQSALQKAQASPTKSQELLNSWSRYPGFAVPLQNWGALAGANGVSNETQNPVPRAKGGPIKVANQPNSYEDPRYRASEKEPGNKQSHSRLLLADGGSLWQPTVDPGLSLPAMGAVPSPLMQALLTGGERAPPEATPQRPLAPTAQSLTRELQPLLRARAGLAAWPSQPYAPLSSR